MFKQGMITIMILPSIITKSGIIKIRQLVYGSSYLSELAASFVHLTERLIALNSERHSRLAAISKRSWRGRLAAAPRPVLKAQDLAADNAPTH